MTYTHIYSFTNEFKKLLYKGAVCRVKLEQTKLKLDNLYFCRDKRSEEFEIARRERLLKSMIVCFMKESSLG